MFLVQDKNSNLFSWNRFRTPVNLSRTQKLQKLWSKLNIFEFYYFRNFFVSIWSFKRSPHDHKLFFDSIALNKYFAKTSLTHDLLLSKPHRILDHIIINKVPIPFFVIINYRCVVEPVVANH